MTIEIKPRFNPTINLGKYSQKGRIAPKTAFKKGHKSPCYWEGKKLSKKHKEKIRKSSGKNKGKHWKLSEESRRNISIGHMGNKAYNWKGGISPSTRARYAPRPNPGKCEVCGRLDKENKKGICYDHDHKTGRFRGWICLQCNSILGLAGDDIKKLEKLIIYLKVFTESKEKIVIEPLNEKDFEDNRNT